MSNTTTLTGNLTREPEIRYTREGHASVTFGLAVNRRWQDHATREWQESVSFVDVVVWREQAENAAMSLGTGQRVIVTGRLEQRSWETEGGERRSKLELVAEEVGASLRFARVQATKVDRLRGADRVADDDSSPTDLDPSKTGA